MKRIVKEIKEDVVQITVCDERWYQIGDDFLPSVTWICSFFPKGIAFHKWLASKGWDEAEAIKSAAGDKGSKVHSAIEDLIDGKTIPMEARYYNRTTEQDEELTLEEYECLMAFKDWYLTEKPEILEKELVVVNKEKEYAGTLDIVCKLKGELWIVDCKTGQYIWPEHELQISGYKPAYGKPVRLGILQLGFRRNKRRWKFTEVKDKFSLFLAARTIWAAETEKVRPLKKDYPLSLCLEPKKRRKNNVGTTSNKR